MIRRLCEFGPVTMIHFGPIRNYVISDPGYIDEVLMDRDDVYIKDRELRNMKQLLGQGLLTADGETWRRNRKLAAPALKRKQIEAYAEWMVELTQQALDRWEDGRVFDLHHEMMAVTLKVVFKTLFNVAMDERVDEIGRCIDEAMEAIYKRTHTPWRLVPSALPLPSAPARQFDRAVARLDEVVYDLIARRKQDMSEGDDLLYRLLIANDDDGGMSNTQLRDEILTMFIAGHETTALTLSYAWYRLSFQPEIAQRLFDEVDAVLGGRTVTAADTQHLVYTKAIVQETLRMDSPAWIIGREAVRDTTLGPYLVKQGTQMLMPQSVLHYDPRYFEQPHEFRPERWLDPSFEKGLPRGVYFPFGGGPRVCAGQYFAMMELLLMVATMAQNFALENVMTAPLTRKPAITLRPAVPITMRARRRANSASAKASA